MQQCRNPIKHRVKEHDSLYLLARQYKTTVPAILSLNDRLDPYDLRIGTYINICPGDDFTSGNNHEGTHDMTAQIALMNNMRLAWSQHVYWTRLVIISIIEKLNDVKATEQRLMQNPGDIANIYRAYYPEAVALKINQLLTEHLQIGGELITALRDNKTAEIKSLAKQWYINADKIAEAFSSINPYYDRESLKKMLYSHLDLTTQEVATYLAANYPASIQAFNRIEDEAMMMADYFAAGLIKQFPQKFF